MSYKSEIKIMIKQNLSISEIVKKNSDPTYIYNLYLLIKNDKQKVYDLLDSVSYDELYSNIVLENHPFAVSLCKVIEHPRYEDIIFSLYMEFKQHLEHKNAFYCLKKALNMLFELNLDIDDSYREPIFDYIFYLIDKYPSKERYIESLDYIIILMNEYLITPIELKNYINKLHSKPSKFKTKKFFETINYIINNIYKYSSNYIQYFEN